jgi:hypothetical protein
MDGQGMRLLRGRPSHVPTEYCFWRLLSVFRPEAGGRERESRVKAGKNLWPPLIRGVRIQNLSLTGVLADGRDLEDSLPSGGAWPPARLAAAHHPRRARAAPPDTGRPRRLRGTRTRRIAGTQAAALRAVVGLLGHRFPHPVPSPQGTAIRSRHDLATFALVVYRYEARIPCYSCLFYVAYSVRSV